MSANIRSGDKLVKYLMTKSMPINLDMLGMFKKSRIVGKKDYSLVIIIHGHGTLYWKMKLLKKRTYQSILEEVCIIAWYSASTVERDNVLFFTPSRDKVPTNECVVPRNRFLITTIACIARVIVGLHAKIIV